MCLFQTGMVSPVTTVDTPVEATTAISVTSAGVITARNAVCAAMDVMKLSVRVV